MYPAGHTYEDFKHVAFAGFEVHGVLPHRATLQNQAHLKSESAFNKEAEN